MAQGLNQNVSHWTELSLARSWIHSCVTILDNEEQLSQQLVQQRFGAWMIFMSDHREQLGSLVDSIPYLLKITRSYWSGLFHCHQIDNLPKTNNDLEQVFGSFRHHTRRTTGRKKAPTSMLIRGSTRLIAAVVTRIKTFTSRDLATVDLVSWRDQRSHLEQLRHTRLQQRRFRRNPNSYLLELETKLIQSILPP